MPPAPATKPARIISPSAFELPQQPSRARPIRPPAVPSFNDLCTNSNDDCEAMERDTAPKTTATMVPKTPEAATVELQPAARTSNKTDQSLPGLTSAVAMDIHKARQ